MTFNWRALLGLSDPEPLWRPEYQPLIDLWIGQPSNPRDPSTVVSKQPLNQQYFVTQATAYWLANTYGGRVIVLPPAGSGGVEYSPAKEYHLMFDDGASINAGFLAYYYCPAGNDPFIPAGQPGSGRPSPAAVDNPSLVTRECRDAISQKRADYARG